MKPIEQYARQLLRPLGDSPSGPSRVDIARAVADGRRRQSRRRAAMLSGLSVLVATVTAAAVLVGRPDPDAGPVPAHSTTGTAGPTPTGPNGPPPPTDCSVTRLPILAGHRSSLVTGASRKGTYVVGATSPDEVIGLEGDIGGPGADRHPVIWHGDDVTEVPMVGTWRELNDVNSSGVAVGVTSEVWNREDYRLRSTPWMYRDGTLSRLPGLSGYPSVGVEAINDAGVMVGNGSDPSRRSRPLIWRDPDRPPTPLPLPPGVSTGSVAGIENDGTVVGSVGDDKTARAYMWGPDGSGRALPTPHIAGRPAKYSIARAIAGAWVLGSATNEDYETTTVLWNRRRDSVTLRPGSELWLAVNPLGWTVGYGHERRPVYGWADGVVALPEPAPGQDLGTGVAVSDDGKTIAGYLSTEPGAAVWQCR
jgi:uncharacterized membrane protein